MSHLNYNHLYYFWMTQKKGSVTQAAEALFLTPQTVTGQIKLLEQRLGGKLLMRKGRSLEATELGQLVFRYADKMFSLSYEMLDIVNYRKESQILFDVGIADALSKRLASRVLLSVIPNDGSIHLRCFESTHELLLEQLSEHKLDMILGLPGGLQPARRSALQAARWLRGQLLLQGAAAVAPFSGLSGGAQAADPGPAHRHGAPADPVVRAARGIAQHPRRV